MRISLLLGIVPDHLASKSLNRKLINSDSWNKPNCYMQGVVDRRERTFDCSIDKFRQKHMLKNLMNKFISSGL